MRIIADSNVARVIWELHRRHLASFYGPNRGYLFQRRATSLSVGDELTPVNVRAGSVDREHPWIDVVALIHERASAGVEAIDAVVGGPGTRDAVDNDPRDVAPVVQNEGGDLVPKAVCIPRGALELSLAQVEHSQLQAALGAVPRLSDVRAGE